MSPFKLRVKSMDSLAEQQTRKVVYLEESREEKKNTMPEDLPNVLTVIRKPSSTGNLSLNWRGWER